MNHGNSTPPRIVPLEGDEDALRRAIAHVLHAEQSSRIGKMLARVEQLPTVRAAAIGSKSTDDAAWGVWHYGASFMMYGAGAEPLLDRCDLTQNERERSTLLMRRAETYGEQVLVVVSHLSAKQPTNLPKQIDCLGLVFCPKDS